MVKKEYLETFTNLEPFTGKLQSFQDLRKTGEIRSFKLRDELDPNKVIEKFEARIIGFNPENHEPFEPNIGVVFHTVKFYDKSGVPHGEKVEYPMNLVDSDILQTANNESQDLSPEK